MTKYWFRQKRFGYGATPNTWQGWLFVAGITAAAVAIALTARLIQDDFLRSLFIPGGIALVLIVSLIVAVRKTEGGLKWRWGGDDSGTP